MYLAGEKGGEDIYTCYVCIGSLDSLESILGIWRENYFSNVENRGTKYHPR